jgi:DNA segregation ATPase FtsK/SpoIIIE, S-DNA-T family
MAKKNTKDFTTTKEKAPTRKLTRQQKFSFGVLLVLLALALMLSFVSFFITGNNDQSLIGDVLNREAKAENWLGKIGAFLADFFIVKGFGVASFIFIRILFLAGAYLILDSTLGKLKKILFWDLYLIIIISILFGFFWYSLPQLGGTVGFEMNLFIQDYIGKIGVGLLLTFGVIIFLIFKIKISPDKIKDILERPSKELKEELNQADLLQDVSFEDNSKLSPDISASTDINTGDDDFIIREDEEAISKIELKPTSSFEINKEELKPTISYSSELTLEPKLKTAEEIQPEIIKEEETITENDFVIEKIEEEVSVTENLAS